MNSGFASILAGWQETQRVFWTAAAGKPAFDNANDFAPPDWQAFDGFAATLMEQVLPVADHADTQRAQAALISWRDMVSAAWQSIQLDFDAQRRALWHPETPPDWRLLRGRWLATAEAEFLRLQRRGDFLQAQGALLRATVDLLEKIPPQTRQALAATRVAAGSAATTLRDLGLDGVRIARTDRDIIRREGKRTLSRYRPLDGAGRSLGPVLICHGLIGRQTMTDLLPERSAVRQLLAAGADVFVLDWGSADIADHQIGLNHIVRTILPEMIEAACTEADTEQLVLMGICQGGTLALCHAALDARRLKGLILAVAPFDFHADVHDADPAHGLINHWLRALDPNDLERLVALEGNLSGELLGAVFNQLNPVRTLSKYAVEMLQTAADPAAFRIFMAMEKWLADRPDIPGRLAREWLIDFYQLNVLARNNLRIGGQPVRPGDIDLPILNIFATADHIVPPPCTRALANILPDGSNYSELALPTGHVGLFVSERAQTLLVPQIVRWLRQNA